jgi:hypothetical protein
MSDDTLSARKKARELVSEEPQPRRQQSFENARWVERRRLGTRKRRAAARKAVTTRQLKSTI